MTSIKSRVIKYGLVEWRRITDWQQDVKTIDANEMDKLLNSFDKHGFFDNFLLWEQPNGFICIHGHQRLKALHKADALGWTIPDKLPAIYLDIKNEKEAREMILAAASTFGQINKDELIHFIEDNKLDMSGLASTTHLTLPNTETILDLQTQDDTGESSDDKANKKFDDLSEDYKDYVLKIPNNEYQVFIKLLDEVRKSVESNKESCDYTIAGALKLLILKYLKKS